MPNSSLLSLPLGFDEWLPGAQAVTLGLLTFLQEDVPTVSAALLAAAGHLTWQAGLLGVFLGIWIGDALLYLLARGLGRPLLQRSWANRFFDAAGVARSEQWFAEKGTWLLLTSRFVPGTRLPTYLAAGFLRLPFGRFLSVTGIAVAVWTIGIFLLAKTFGPGALSWLQQWSAAGWAVVLLTVVLVFILRASARVFLGRGLRPAAINNLFGDRGRCLASERRIAKRSGLKSALLSLRVRAALGRWTRWEFWPAWLFYIPVGVNYAWLAIRYRGLTLPTAANPGIFSGGFVGESKIATLRDLQATRPEFVAEAILLPDIQPPGTDSHRTGDAHRSAIPSERRGENENARFALLEKLRREHDIDYPFILKPDVGQRGVGVKLVRTADQAAAYLQQTSAPLVIQRYAPGPREVGVFYYRFPHEPRGSIFAITEKLFPTVTGDGQHTIEQLVWQDERARFIAARYLRRLGDRRSEVLRSGETVKLVQAGNHAQGCVFKDGWRLWSEELERRMDDISQRLEGFFIGRYDIRYSSEADLRAGRKFQIIELNGAASEDTSIYDARNSLRSAYGALFRQWELVFAIGAANRRRGAAPASLALLWHKWRETTALAASYPLAD